MSFKVQVQVVNDAKWYDNGLRFATQEDAEAYGQDLHGRWMQTEKYQTVECDDAPNSVFVDGKARPYELWETSK